jgi:uncharacterized protein (DUF1778 family)
MDTPSAHTDGRDQLTVVELHLTDFTCSMIDKAASLLGKSRTEFIVDAARDAAQNAILDQRIIMVSPEEYDRLLEILKRPPEVVEGLRKLFEEKAPWDE